MKTRRIEPLLHVLRATLLVSSLLAGATAAVWAWRPGWVEDLDARLVSARIGEPAALLEEILQEEPGSPESRARLTAFLDELGPVPRGEHRAELRRSALRSLVGSYEEAGERDAALARLEELVAFDSRDLQARLDRARYLHQSAERRDEGRAEFDLLYQLLPEDLRVVEAYVEALLADGELDRALTVAIEHDRNARSLLWRLAWKPSPNATERQALVMPLLDADGVLNLAITIEGPVRYVRIELPERLAMLFEDPTLTVRHAGQVATLRLLDEGGRLVGLFPNGRLLYTSGRSNAFFEYDLQSGPKAAATDLHFQAGFSWGVSPALEGLASRPEVNAALTAPGSTLDPVSVESLRVAALRRAMVKPLEVFWSVGKQSFDGRRRALGADEVRSSAEGFDFVSSVPVDHPAERLRLDLPDAQGLTWELESLELICEEGALALAPSELALLASHSLVRASGHFTVEGLDPWLAFEVPDAPRRILTVRITGSVR